MPTSTDCCKEHSTCLFCKLSCWADARLGSGLRIQQISKMCFRLDRVRSIQLSTARIQGLDQGEWGNSENNRRAKFYRLTAAGGDNWTANGDMDRLSAAIGWCWAGRGGAAMIGELLTRIRFLIFARGGRA